ncbi:hypothetical protein EDB92DRAFT_1820263 [Lactarius akahatsu]|uniref:Uncharacterized protein n=1 Tax=Lactarius akahatsu TaxID=416441 RepID=A0AAD4L9S9_9AGAM|nr:hypothetical protein EDB92DRAFT_1820263 [Lactarius akahatsu]
MRVSLEPRKIENHQKKSVIVRAWSGNDSSQISNRGLIKEAEVHFQVYRTRGKSAGLLGVLGGSCLSITSRWCEVLHFQIFVAAITTVVGSTSEKREIHIDLYQVGGVAIVVLVKKKDVAEVMRTRPKQSFIVQLAHTTQQRTAHPYRPSIQNRRRINHVPPLSLHVQSQRSPPEHSPSTATDPSSATGGNPGAEHGRKPSVQQSAQDVVVPGRATNKWRRLSSIISRAAAIHATVEAQQFPGDLLRISIPRVGVSALSPRDDGGDEKASPLSSPPLAW